MEVSRGGRALKLKLWCSLLLVLACSGASAGPGGSPPPVPFLLKQGQKVELDTLPKTTPAAFSSSSDDAPANLCVTTIDEERGIYYVRGFLTPEECEAVIALGTPDRYDRSPLTGGKSTEGGFFHGTHRTSSTCPLLFARMYMPAIETLREKKPEYVPELELSWKITQRAARVLGTDESHFEPLQMIKYEPGEYYKKHHDHKGYYSPETGYPDRCKTMLLFLNDVESGGHLLFDKLGLEFVPRQGDAVVWSNVKPNGEVDRDMVHQGLPPEEGSKYAMNIWVRDEPIEIA